MEQVLVHVEQAQGMTWVWVEGDVDSLDEALDMELAR
jgi:hypothetical protein